MKKFLAKFGIWGSLDYPIDKYAAFKLTHDKKRTRWIGVQLRWFAIFFVVERRK